MTAVQSAFFWFGLLLLLPQALWVRTRAVRFADAAGPTEGLREAHGEGDADGAVEPDPSADRDAADAREALRLVGIGDSIIAGVGARTNDRALVGQTALCLAASLRREVRWRVFGGTGSTSRGVLARLVPQLPDESVDAFVVSVGVNDVTALRRLQTWRHDLSALVDALRRAAPGAPVVLLGIPPLGRFPRLPQPLRALFGLRGAGFDAVARQLAAARPGVVHVPLEPREFRPEGFAPDGYHPSEESYAKLATVMGAGVLAGLVELAYAEA